MALSRWRNRTLILMALSLSLVFLASCAGNTQNAQSSPTPTPTLPQGQQLLTKTNSLLTSAKTLQGMLNLKVSGQSLNGTLNTSVWSIAPDKIVLRCASRRWLSRPLVQ